MSSPAIRTAAIDLPRIVQRLQVQLKNVSSGNAMRGEGGVDIAKTWRNAEQVVGYAQRLMTQVTNAGALPAARLSALDKQLNDIKNQVSHLRESVVEDAKPVSINLTSSPTALPALPPLNIQSGNGSVSQGSSSRPSLPLTKSGDDVISTTLQDTHPSRQSSHAVSLQASANDNLSSDSGFGTRPLVSSPSASMSGNLQAPSPFHRSDSSSSRMSTSVPRRPRRRILDQKPGESGLLPVVKSSPRGGKAGGAADNRIELMRGANKELNMQMGMKGARELHEEMGEQLADMSKQLKLNAIHFSKSLENDKGLLESAADALETNLTRTQTSKSKLKMVASKTGGTTWLTMLSILVVLIGWVWTYLLIRMT